MVAFVGPIMVFLLIAGMVMEFEVEGVHKFDGSNLFLVCLITSCDLKKDVFLFLETYKHPPDRLKAKSNITVQINKHARVL